MERGREASDRCRELRGAAAGCVDGAAARISRSLLTTWRRARDAGRLGFDAPVSFTPLVVAPEPTSARHGAAPAMIAFAPSARVWLAGGATDMRRGVPGLALMVQEVLKRDPHAGDVFVFRGRGGSLLKVLWHDGMGMSLYAKRL